MRVDNEYAFKTSWKHAVQFVKKLTGSILVLFSLVTVSSELVNS